MFSDPCRAFVKKSLKAVLILTLLVQVHAAEYSEAQNGTIGGRQADTLFKGNKHLLLPLKLGQRQMWCNCNIDRRAHQDSDG